MAHVEGRPFGTVGLALGTGLQLDASGRLAQPVAEEHPQAGPPHQKAQAISRVAVGLMALIFLFREVIEERLCGR
jgi:hypothetical protein